jgi:transposase
MLKNNDQTTDYKALPEDKLIELLQQQSEQIKSLQHQVEWFKRQLFGSKSEKKDFTDHPYQATIADVLDELPKLPEKNQDEKQEITYQRGKAKKDVLAGSPDDSGLRFDESVPVEVIHIPSPELAGDDKDQYTVIGEKVTYRLAQQPASFVVLKYIRQVVKEKTTQVITAPTAPPAVFEKSVADVSFLAGMLVDKFMYHLPLYRQHQRLEQNGFRLARSTLTHLVKRSIELLQPIYQAQLDHILLSKILAIDETATKAGKAKKGKLKQAWYWPIFGEANEICFTFSLSRGVAHLKKQLGDFRGTIVSDGYKAYECYSQALDHVTQALCWVHTRRYFDEAEKSEPEQVAVALSFIAKLYKVEERIKQETLTGEAKRVYRRQFSQPVVDKFFSWLNEQSQRIDLIPSDPFSKALAYAKKRESGLRVFLEDPDVPLDTNHVERGIRGVAMGRRNWLFSWTEIGAEHVGIIHSLIYTCRLHGVRPYDYLVDVLQRVDRHPASDILELTPRVWKEKFGDNPLRSDLYKG